jgi:hypothetical protein
VTPQPGWFQRQCESVSREVAQWPAWMRRAAGFKENSTMTDAEQLEEKLYSS